MMYSRFNTSEMYAQSEPDPPTIRKVKIIKGCDVVTSLLVSRECVLIDVFAMVQGYMETRFQWRRRRRREGRRTAENLRARQARGLAAESPNSPPRALKYDGRPEMRILALLEVGHFFGLMLIRAVHSMEFIANGRCAVWLLVVHLRLFTLRTTQGIMPCTPELLRLMLASNSLRLPIARSQLMV